MKATPADVHAFLGSDVCSDLRTYLQAEIDTETATLLEDTYIDPYDIGGSRAAIKVLKSILDLESIFVKQDQREAEEAKEKEAENAEDTGNND